MAALLAGLPDRVGGVTLNRLCASGLAAVGSAARAIPARDAALLIDGGVESMSRAAFVMPKTETAFSRPNAGYDYAIGGGFVNHRMQTAYGVDSIPSSDDPRGRKGNVTR